ncbi:hypothetical protein D3H65_06410 [Paraflavitalea soli]|uniref:Uncharacterized protein n=1 Tax=Paraflavitalea soli TaxID=2315862 RepID=A0A3B7MPY6_9BACT|nr:hypothetical protein D3H65_06410 [Paraflavitalea soli]
MFSKPIKYLLVATSIAPIVFVYWLVGVLRSKDLSSNYGLLITLVLLLVACKVILNFAEAHLEVRSINLKSVKSADHNIISFLFVYLLPIFDFVKKDDYYIWAFVVIVVFVVIINTNTYHFNPLLSLVFRYKFYEVATKGEITFILITKQQIINVEDVRKYIQLTPYVILDVT